MNKLNDKSIINYIKTTNHLQNKQLAKSSNQEISLHHASCPGDSLWFCSPQMVHVKYFCNSPSCASVVYR